MHTLIKEYRDRIVSLRDAALLDYQKKQALVDELDSVHAFAPLRWDVIACGPWACSVRFFMGKVMIREMLFSHEDSHSHVTRYVAPHVIEADVALILAKLHEVFAQPEHIRARASTIQTR